MNRTLRWVALIAMFVLQAARTEEGLARTDPSTWSKDGYLQFRWGMGPGDVAAALHAPDAVLKTEDRFQLSVDDASPAEDNYAVVVFGFEIAGYDMLRALFGFDHGRLFRIELNPVVPGAPWPRWKEWHLKFSDLLTKKYGKPLSESVTDRSLWLSSWVVPASRLHVMIISSETRSALVYAEPFIEQEATRKFRARREAAERAAAKPALDKL
jgi:hypothetical protein